MIHDRNGSFLHSLLMPFRKTRRHDESETNDSSAQESRQRLEQRIELALANVSVEFRYRPSRNCSHPLELLQPRAPADRGRNQTVMLSRAAP